MDSELETIKYILSRLTTDFPFRVLFENGEVLFQQRLINRQFKQVAFSEEVVKGVLKETTPIDFLTCIRHYLKTL